MFHNDKVYNVTILDFEYDIQRKIIILKIVDDDTGEKLAIAISVNDLLMAMNIRYDLTHDLLIFFLNELKGKKKKWQSTADIKFFDTQKIKDMTDSEFMNHHFLLDELYPYQQILDKINLEKN